MSYFLVEFIPEKASRSACWDGIKQNWFISSWTCQVSPSLTIIFSVVCFIYLCTGGRGGLDASPGVNGIPCCTPSTKALLSNGPGEGRPGEVGTISIWEPWIEERTLLVLLCCWVKRNFRVPPDLGTWNRKWPVKYCTGEWQWSL